MNRKEEMESAASSSKFKKLAILFAVLFALALLGLIYLFTANSSLQSQSQAQKNEIESLDGERTKLQSELASIENDFSQKITENEDLSSTLESKLKEVEELQWRIQDARKKLKSSKEENEEIKTKLAQLESLKAELEKDIAALASTNSDLKVANAAISAELSSTKEYAEDLSDRLTQMTERNDKLIDRLYKIAPAGYVADNFIVTAKKRNDKLTSKAKYTDEVNVSFDLNDVPAEFHGEKEIYLVLTKFDGQPVASVPAKKIRITARDPFDIEAAEIQKIALKDRQHLEMSVPTNKDLEAGTYNLLVYASHGFLGATSFQLRK